MKKKYYRRKDILKQDIKKFGKVLLTQKQYEKLIAIYGEDLTNFAIRLLDEKISTNKNDKKLCYAKNHYQYFRRDSKIINFALEMLNSTKNYGPIQY